MNTLLVDLVMDSSRRRTLGKGKQKLQLKRQLGYFDTVSFICGFVIGTGIWVSPQAIMQSTNSIGASLIIWIIWGILSICLGLSYSELGATFPRSGGKYVYLEEAFGPFVSFLYIWSYNMLVRPAANTLRLLTFAVYILKPFYPDCDIPKPPVILLGLTLGLFVVFVNIRDVKLAARGQGLFTGICVVALLAISALGFVHLATGFTNNFTYVFEGTTDNPTDLILGFVACYFCYAGMDVVNFVIEEVTKPTRTIPLALVTSCTLITILYIMANIAFCVVLGKDGIIESQAVAASFAQATFGRVALIMSLLIGINTAGSFNCGQLVGSRLCFVAARKGYLPSVLNFVHIEYLSPLVALIFINILGTFYMFMDLRNLLNNFVIVGVLSDGLAMAALIRLRFSQPHIKRPFRVPLYIPCILVVILALCVIVPVIMRPLSTAVGLAITMCTGIPYYVIFIRWKPPISLAKKLYIPAVVLLQKVLKCAKEDTLVLERN